MRRRSFRFTPRRLEKEIAMYRAPVELKVIKAKHLKGFVWNARISRYSKVYPVTAYLYMDTGREYDGFTASLVQEFHGGPPFTLHFCGTRDSHERWCGIYADCFARALEEAEKRIPYYAFLFGVENEKRHYKTQARLSPSQRS